MNVELPKDFKKDLLVGFVGAILGGILTYFIDGFSDSQNRLNQIKLEGKIIEIKEYQFETIDDLVAEVAIAKSEAKKLKGQLTDILKDSKSDINKVRESAKIADEILLKLKNKTQITDEQLIELFMPAIEAQVSSIASKIKEIPKGAMIYISNKEKCPAGSVEVANLSVQVAKGKKQGYINVTNITGNTSWDVSKNYDGRLFKTCLYNR